jgi:hypothetical protein
MTKKPGTGGRRRWTLLAASGIALLVPGAQVWGQAAPNQVPPYITAKPDAIIKAYGRETADKIFSHALTPLRRDAVQRSQKAIPGFECPSDPQIALSEVIPYPVQRGVVSWIERFTLGCTPRTMRNFLIIVEAGQPRSVELLPGLSNTDPLLQRDAMKGAAAFAATARPQGCEKTIVTDTRLNAPPERSGWVERWTYDLCGSKAEVEMTFTTSDRGGTNWNAKLVK